jgi:hypothetical protein
MAFSTSSFFIVTFFLMFLFIVWLKYREHLHAHRHEHGPHSDRTDHHHRARTAQKS